MKRSYVGIAAMLAAFIVGCGGGGGGSVAPATSAGGGGGGGSVTLPTPNSGASSTATQRVTLAIVIPKGVTTASNSRKAQYIPSNTAAMSLTLISVNGVATTGATQGPFNLTAPSATNVNPSCTVVAAGTSCTFSIAAPTGTDIFTATTFADAKGTVALGSGSVAFAVLQNATNTASLTLAGPVASVSLLSSTAALTNGNPIPPIATPTGQPSQPPAVARNPGTQSTARAAGSRRILGATVTPAPLLPPVTSARIFVIALDAQGNQIINPTTFDTAVTITLTMAGLPANAVALNVAHAGLSSADSGTNSVSSDGGTIYVWSPSDQVTLTLGTVTAPGTFAPTLVASFVPTGGSQTVTSLPLSYSVNVNAPGPTYGIALTHPQLYTNVPGALTIVATNGGNAPTAGNTRVNGTIYGASVVSFTGTDATYWNCAVTYTNPPYQVNFGCTVIAGTIAATTSAPPITINVSAPYSGMSDNATLTDSSNVYVNAQDSASVSSGATPSPAPAISLSSQATTVSNGEFFGGGTGGGYTHTVNNNGGAASTSTVTVTDTLDANLTYTGFTGSGWGCSAAGSVVTCTYSGSLPASGSATPLFVAVTPTVGISGSQVFSQFAVSGGGGSTSGDGYAFTNVDYALQFEGSNLASNTVLFSVGPSYNNGTSLATLDFGSPPNGVTGNVVLTSFTSTSTSYTVTSDTCGSFINASTFESALATNLANMAVLQTTSVPITATAAIYGGPCMITVSGAGGITAQLNIQVEQIGVIVNGRKRK